MSERAEDAAQGLSAKPGPPPRCCWNCGHTFAFCQARGEEERPSKCCRRCIHPPRKPLPPGALAEMGLPPTARIRSRVREAWWAEHPDRPLVPKVPNVGGRTEPRGRRRR
jgi:hypothetical protein